MANSLTSDLKDGYCQVARALSEDNLALLSRARDSTNCWPAERNGALAEIVAAYRAGPRQLWGPILLDLLAPALLRRLQRLRAVPPVVDEDEIRQQLILEMLHAAATIPMTDPSKTKRRLITSANKSVKRWLAREGRRQARQSSFEHDEEVSR
jgi:hypothetical protein